MSRLMIISVVAVLISGCAYPGKTDLADSGTTTSLTVIGEQKQISQCVTDVMDAEHWSMWDLQTPVTRVVYSPDGNTTELQAGMATMPTILYWTMTFTQVDPVHTHISIVTRHYVGPKFSSHYMADKAQQALHQCSTS